MKMFRKLMSLMLALIMVASLAACGGNSAANNSTPDTPAATSGGDNAQEGNPVEHKGTIMWLSNITSGVVYDSYKAYSEAICAKLGYDFVVVYGDSFNDPAGNLTSVTNGMTSDVVGIILSQDGGIDAIMEQYPNLYVAGCGTDMRSVFAEGGAASSVLGNDHFLGTVCDGYSDGKDMGDQYFEAAVEKGYKKVSVVSFPGYAYPNLAEGVQAFLANVEEYNATAAEDDKITVVGEPTVLEFQPLADSYFLEDGMGDLDAVIAFCSGLQFVYPTMITAKMNGACRADTQLVTGGFDNNADIIADVGDDKTISWIGFCPVEDIAYSLILLDNAITGNLPDDFHVECMDGAPYVIDSTEDIENVMSKSMIGSGDISKAMISVDEIVSVCGRNNSEFTFADLQEFFHSEQIMVDALKNR